MPVPAPVSSFLLLICPVYTLPHRALPHSDTEFKYGLSAPACNGGLFFFYVDQIRITVPIHAM